MIKKNGILRIIDANLNRALEGLRITEEIARFIVQDKNLTYRLKMVRHQVKEGIEGLRINRQELLIARDASGDVGASAYVKDELQRSDIKEVLKVNFRRTEEALRVLEEFTKLLKPLSSLVFKKLRFKVYSLEKQMFTSSSLS